MQQGLVSNHDSWMLYLLIKIDLSTLIHEILLFRIYILAWKSQAYRRITVTLKSFPIFSNGEWSKTIKRESLSS